MSKFTVFRNAIYSQIGSAVIEWFGSKLKQVLNRKKDDRIAEPPTIVDATTAVVSAVSTIAEYTRDSTSAREHRSSN